MINKTGAAINKCKTSKLETMISGINTTIAAKIAYRYARKFG
jgi:hypothetical protein